MLRRRARTTKLFSIKSYYIVKVYSAFWIDTRKHHVVYMFRVDRTFKIRLVDDEILLRVDGRSCRNLGASVEITPA